MLFLENSLVPALAASRLPRGACPSLRSGFGLRPRAVAARRAPLVGRSGGCVGGVL